MKAYINGVLKECKTVENMGYQGGHYVKAVLCEGTEYIVIKDGKIWRTIDFEEKLKTIKTTRKQLYRYESLITCEHKAIIGNNHKNPELLEGLNGKTD